MHHFLRLLPIGLALGLAGCNPSSNTDNTITDAQELAMAKSFVQDFSGLQDGLMSLETPVQNFKEQVDSDFNSISESDREAFSKTLGYVMNELIEVVESMGETIDLPEGQGYVLEFTDASYDFTTPETHELQFDANSSWAITSAGVVTASGTATHMGSEAVSFDISMTLPEFSTEDAGNLTYDLVADINVTGDNIILDVNNGNGSLNLSLGDSTLGNFGDNGLDSDDTINNISLGLDNSSITAGGLALSGAMELDVSNLDASDNLDVAFSVNVEGELTNSANQSYGASLALTNGSVNRDYTSTDLGHEETTSIGMDYAITTAFTTNAHDFDVTLNGTFGVNVDIVDTVNTSSDEYSMTIDGDLLISHNDALFNIDYDVDASLAGSSFTEGSNQIDIVVQDATETEQTVQILMGDYDEAGTTALEFGVVRVNGTQYGILDYMNNRTTATFEDGSTLVVFDSND